MQKVTATKPISFNTLCKSISKNKTYQGLDQYRKLVRATLQGVTEPLQFVGGRPGVGKSHILREECAKAGVEPVFINPTNPHLFSQELYRFRDSPVVVMDDCDSLASAPKVASIVKMAYGADKKVFWPTVQGNKNAKRGIDHEHFDPDMPPREFGVRTKLVWLSNLNFTNLDKVRDDMRMSFEAICSRGGDPLWLDAGDLDTFRYTMWLGTVGCMFHKSKLFNSQAEAADAVNWFNDNRNHLRELSPRTLAAIASYIHKANGVGLDKKMLNALLSKKLMGKPMRDIPGFNKLEMIGRGKWQEKS